LLFDPKSRIIAVEKAFPAPQPADYVWFLSIVRMSRVPPGFGAASLMELLKRNPVPPPRRENMGDRVAHP
jgi:hypothetical protein